MWRRKPEPDDLHAQQPAALVDGVAPAGQRGVGVDGDAGHAPHRRSHAAALALEGGEVVLADEDRGGLGHRRQRQPLRHVPGHPAQRRMIHRRVPDEVAIGLAAGVQPGVEAVERLLGGEHPHVGRQRGVEGAHQPVGGNRRGEPDAGHLRGGMDAGIGAAGAGDVHRRPFDGGEHRLELALHRALPGLALPPGEVRAVVRHDQAQRPDAGAHLRRTYLREPGLIASEPAAQSGQDSGG